MEKMVAENPMYVSSGAVMTQIKGSTDLFELTRNLKDKEYVGTNFMKTPRPERFKRYDGPYISLKTTMSKANEIIPLHEMNIQLLEQLLLISYSITSVKFYGYQSEMVWSYPSAGACYPVEVYVVINNVEGVVPGVYHYSPVNAILHRISNLEHDFLLKESVLPEDYDANFYLIFTVVPWRSCWKYSYRGYRFGYIDTGHILANFQLVLSSMDVPYSAYTHCRSQYLKTLLNLDAMEEPVGIISIGNNKRHPLERPIRDAVFTAMRDEPRSRPVFNSKEEASTFDWTPITGIQEAVKLETYTPVLEWKSSYKVPAPWKLDELSAHVFKRRSCSAFLPVPIASSDLSEMLSLIADMEFPIQLYTVIHAVEDYTPGLYRVDQAGAVLIQQGDYRSESLRLCLDQDFVYDSSVVFFFAADRTNIAEGALWKTQQRLIDAGALGQMMYLKSRTLNLGFSVIGGYYDLEARDLFGLDVQVEMIYCGVLGKEDTNSAFKVKKDRYQLNLPNANVSDRNGFQGEQNQMIIELLKERAARFGHRLALKFGDESYTYAEFWEQIERYAERFKQEIPNDYPVGINMRNHPVYLFTYYGLLLSGHIPMLIDHTFTQDEVAFIRDHYHLGSIIRLEKTNEIQIDVFSNVYESFDADHFVNVATCRFSSGTTGKPKCLMFTHEAVLNAATNWAKAASITENDVVLCTALFHNGLAFNTSMLSVFLSGAQLVIHKQLTPKSIWETVTNENISVFVAFPVVFDMLSKSKFCADNHRLRLCLSSSAPLHYHIKNAFRERAGITICDYYGIVEAGPATFKDSKHPDSLGRPITGVDLRIVNEEGETILTDEPGILQIKSSSMAKGYYNSDIAFLELITPDGYYHTNDRAFIRDGYLYVTGRTNDLINVAGKKVDPFEIENVLIKLSGVRDVAVVGVPNNSLTSEYPVAFLVVDEPITEETIVKFCQSRLAPFKLPQKYLFIDQIPRSGVGKIKRQELIEGLHEEAAKS
ncbi:long-chain acyl-CoA synthetase [Paenibacillus phyllosphaerae]|uniref:Long-chain acyl-CoA synthetase n=1 Tax=Paenibacillus phyllosphaerae TaxID=274593 RepID=A0A7W5B437_9BACL|nr:AMP-binding protein [Paenibacillus phyllosphaerae]MBB3114049.1 long-chain acyl-CoA synthetase [Paenibacillus phyllosphaerae]